MQSGAGLPETEPRIGILSLLPCAAISFSLLSAIQGLRGRQKRLPYPGRRGETPRVATSRFSDMWASRAVMNHDHAATS
jgi:hypothetical protein